MYVDVTKRISLYTRIALYFTENDHNFDYIMLYYCFSLK